MTFLREASRKRTVAVTGGAGFVGSHLCDRLLACGWRVVAVDDFSTGDLAHVAHLRGHPRFRVIRQDIATGVPDELAEAERIFNLACRRARRITSAVRCRRP